MHQPPTTPPRSRLCSPVTQRVLYSTHYPLCIAPSNPRGPACAAACGVPRLHRGCPGYTHSPYTPHQPLLQILSQPAYPAYYLREPRYGLPQPPPPPSPLPVVPPPYHRDLELAYVRGHVAGVDHRSENPAPPPGDRAAGAPSLT